jgi:glycerol-3-phosphate dehydrogenase (NAD(P)+)
LKPEQAMSFSHIAVLGAGAWGTALANAAAHAGRKVTLWTIDPKEADAIATTGMSPMLPGVKVNAAVAITTTLADATIADAILLVVPAQASREVVTKAASLIRAGTPLVTCAKGIERGTRKFMTEIISECAPNAVPAILSGPSFAADVARGLPTAVTLAAQDEGVAGALSQAIGTATFRPYHSTDLRGVEIGGAAKNVFAIAAGIVKGRGLGDSAAAALTTRGFAEIIRFGKACGARPETLIGLSGLGDLILTCSSPQSRNFSLGIALGQGKSPLEALGGSKLAEGAYTASVLTDMARERKVEMPIADAIAAVLDGSASVDEAIERLLARPIRAED